MNGWTAYLLLMQVITIVIIPFTIDRPRDPVSPGLGASMALWAVINFWVICQATELI